MDFTWTPEQKRYREAVVAFAQDELNDVIRRDALHEFPYDSWKKCAAFGLQGLPVQKEYGGSGSDPLTIAIALALALAALSYGCRDNGLIFALNAHLWSCVIPVLVFGSAAHGPRGDLAPDPLRARRAPLEVAVAPVATWSG
jgi:alkylation response protein AidB-like acyl-CoA dehydrogenase